MIDAEDVFLVERRQQNAVQRLRGREVATEWLLDDHPRSRGRAAGLRQLLDDRGEQDRRYREIVRGTRGTAKQLSQGRESTRIGIVAVYIT